MQRRTLLATLAGGAAALAGCSGIPGRDSGPSAESIKSTVAKQDRKIQSLQSKIDTLQTNNERLEARVDRLEKGKVAVRYRSALELRNAAVKRWKSAQQSWKNREFAAAETGYAQASGQYASTATAFGLAATAAKDRNQGGARNTCIQAQNHCKFMRSAAVRLSNAMGFYADGDRKKGNAAIERGQNLRKKANNYEVAGIRKIRKQLGISG